MDIEPVSPARRVPRASRVVAGVLVAFVAVLLLRGAVARHSVSALLSRGSGTGAPGAGQAAAAARDDPAARLATLDNSLRAIEDGERTAPRDRWDPDYVVGVVGRDPRRLFAWVRDNTSWIPYRGVLRGPVGVLMDRQGNSLDRALLLATLLEKAGHSVRLAHGALGAQQARALLPALVAREAESVALSAGLDVAPDPEVRAVAARYDLDGAAIERSFDAQSEAVTRFYSELDARVADQSERLSRALTHPDPAPDWTRRFERAEDALRDHWWVQRQDGGRWLDLDVLATTDTSGSPLTSATETTDVKNVAADLHHQLAVRVVIEQWSNGTLSERRVLDHVLQPAELYGRPVVLQFWPGAWPAEVHSDPDARFGLRSAALEQHDWGIALTVGKDAVAQALIHDDGTLREPPAGGPLGGLGAGIAGAVRRPAQQDSSSPRSRELTAAWIEYEIRAPGEAPRTIRRAVFDLIGPAARAVGATPSLSMDDRKRLTRSLSLMLRAEILPLTCQLAPEFVAHLSEQSLLANRKALRSIAGAASSPSQLEPDSLLAGAAQTVSPLYTLALARLERSPFRDLEYVDRIGILTRHRHPGLTAKGFAMRGSVDVVARDVGVSLAEADAFVVRQVQGVLDTNAEALWWVGEGLNNTGEAFASSRDWVTLTAGRGGVNALALPPDARARIAQDLAEGLVVVAPEHPVPRGPDEFVGWWRIDPATGATSGIPGNGWGQCGAEYGVTMDAVVWQAGRSMLFEYALCQGMAQAFNDFRYVGAELQARGIWFWWVGPITSADPTDVFWKNNKGCMISAMKSGLLATLPFLIARYNMATAPWILPTRPPGWFRDLWRDQRGAGRLPPGLVPGPIRGGPPGGTPTLPSIQAPKGAGTAPKGYSNAGAPPGGRGPGGTLPGGSEPAANPLGKTQPDLGKTQPDLGGAQPGRVKTQPGLGEPQAAPRRANPLSDPEAAARENLVNADAAREAAGARSAEAAKGYVQYRANKPNPSADWPGDPANWDPAVDQKMYDAWLQAHQKSIDAINNWRQAQGAARDAAGAARGAQGRGGLMPASPAPQQPPAPNFPGCPPNCGNNNPTGAAGVVQVPASSPSSQIAVGSGGVAISLSPSSGNP